MRHSHTSILLALAILAIGPTRGYYKDLFMDSGIYLTSRTDLPAAEALGLSMEKFVSASHKAADSTRITHVDTVLQTMLL